MWAKDQQLGSLDLSNQFPAIGKFDCSSSEALPALSRKDAEKSFATMIARTRHWSLHRPSPYGPIGAHSGPNWMLVESMSTHLVNFGTMFDTTKEKYMFE